MIDAIAFFKVAVINIMIWKSSFISVNREQISVSLWSEFLQDWTWKSKEKNEDNLVIRWNFPLVLCSEYFGAKNNHMPHGKKSIRTTNLCAFWRVYWTEWSSFNCNRSGRCWFQHDRIHSIFGLHNPLSAIGDLQKISQLESFPRVCSRYPGDPSWNVLGWEKFGADLAERQSIDFSP